MSKHETNSTTGRAEPAWAHIHTKDVSWRKQLIGGIDGLFVVPRYVKLFYDTFGAGSQQDFFEVGSGNGDLSRAILAANRGQVRRYVASEYFEEGVAWLRQSGLEAVRADACRLPCGDGEYDAVLDFDVMHHVDHPRDMARELMRVGRGRTLLVESNGLSFPRRLLEWTPGHRAAGEKSYTPNQYRSFFQGHPGFQVTRFTIYPFLFPFKCPQWLLPMLVWFNRHVERIPALRWQCSSVAICVEYERKQLSASNPGDRAEFAPESAAWQSAHYEEPYYSQRTAKLPAKLRRLGILSMPSHSRILDVCCGRGEALSMLRTLGFRNLEGLDATLPSNRPSGGLTLHRGDAQAMPFPDESFDVILNLHALHHMGGSEGVSRFLAECHRVLKPGGTLAIVDFPASPQIRLLFWLLRNRVPGLTGNLRNFARIVDEEWSYLDPYLQDWPKVRRVLEHSPFQTVQKQQRFFLYYRVMRRGEGRN